MVAPLHSVDPRAAARSQLADFVRFTERATGRRLPDHGALHAFSVEHVGRFWSLFLAWSGALAEGEANPACVGQGVAESRFFPRLRLSWAENVLAARPGADDTAVAVVSVDESGSRLRISRAELRARVHALAAGLDAIGLREGDAVAAVVRNTLDTLVACLAATSLGATWSSVSLDIGPAAALSRLTQVAPKILFLHGSTRHDGARLGVDAEALVGGLPTLERIVALDGEATVSAAATRRALPRATLDELEAEGRARGAGALSPPRRFAFDHPLFVLFSSGTTGAPKAIVHGHGGTLLEHLKEHRLHCDLGPDDAIGFVTSTGWMMWNWTVSALATGARVVLYDGSISHPENDSFLSCAAREGVTVLGVSPAYLHFLASAGVTRAQPRLGRVRTILSTGSVLPSRLHRWAKEHLADVPLESISGGTDILGCFVLGSPWAPTFAGECSSLSLGLDVRAWADGAATRAGTGELVCLSPFPSRPVRFLHDPDGERLRAAYYGQHEGAWTHGDLAEMTERGTVRILGRCDGILNVRGIRIGPSEIYDVVQRFPEVAQALAVDADAPDEPGGKRLVLLVVPRSGATVDRALALAMKRAIREQTSAAHVPSILVSVDELPTTYSAKLSEAALQDALNGRPVRNLDALRNPSALRRAVEAVRAALERPA